MKRLLLAAACTMFLGGLVVTRVQALPKTDEPVSLAACTGSASCRACKNCSSCKHCAKNGGTCGACKK